MSYAVTRIDSGTSVNGEDRPRSNGEAGVLKLSCISGGQFNPAEHKVVVASDLGRVSTPVRAQTIIMSRKNTAALVGVVAYVPSDEPRLYLSDLLWQLHVDPEKANPKWLAAVLSTPDARRRVGATAAGTSGSMKGINKNAILKLEFPFPDLNEQARQLGALEELGYAQGVLDRLLLAKAEYKKGLSEDLLTGRRRFPGFATPWRETKLSRFFVPKDDRAPTKTPLILSCSKVYGILPQSQRFSKQLASVSNAHYKHIVAGDLVYDPMLLWDASIAFSEYEGIVSPAYETLSWIGDEYGDRRFLRALFKSDTMRYVYTTISQGTNARRRKAPVTDFLKVSLKMPDATEQRRIADLLGALDVEIALLRKQRDALNEQKKGLMQKLLTGEVRLKEFQV